jgi:diacylglycerol kinase (ATP)
MNDTWLLLANPGAGRGRAVSRAATALRLLNANGVSARLVVPTSAAELRMCARQAVSDGYAVVVASGGDGTVHQVLQEVAQTPTALAVLPAGTGDDIARSLGMPRDSVSNVVTAWLSGDEYIDAAFVSSHDTWFLGVLSAGFDSRVNEIANARSGGRERYLIAMLQQLRDLQAIEYDVQVDAASLHGPAHLVCVGNGRSYGAGMLVCPQADLHDGLLDLIWLDPIPRGKFLRFFPRVYSGSHIIRPEVVSLRGVDIVIRAPGQVAYADGERLGPLPIEITSMPKAVRVRAAAGASPT